MLEHFLIKLSMGHTDGLPKTDLREEIKTYIVFFTKEKRKPVKVSFDPTTTTITITITITSNTNNQAKTMLPLELAL